MFPSSCRLPQLLLIQHSSLERHTGFLICVIALFVDKSCLSKHVRAKIKAIVRHQIGPSEMLTHGQRPILKNLAKIGPDQG